MVGAIAQHADHLHVLVDEVLQHPPLDADLLVLSELGDDLLDGARDPRRVLAGDSSELLEAVLELALVSADDAAGHQREAQRLAPRFARGLLEHTLALARLVDRCENGVVLVGETHGRAHGARLGGSADADRRASTAVTARPAGRARPVPSTH